MNVSTSAQTAPPPGGLARTGGGEAGAVGGSAVAVVLDPAKHGSPVPAPSSQQDGGTGRIRQQARTSGGCW